VVLSWGPSSSKSSLVSQHSSPYLVDTKVMHMQSSADTTPIFLGDASLDLDLSYPIQPKVKEVVMLMKYLVDPTLIF
jgi:hypothetical protein